MNIKKLAIDLIAILVGWRNDTTGFAVTCNYLLEGVSIRVDTTYRLFPSVQELHTCRWVRGVIAHCPIKLMGVWA